MRTTEKQLRQHEPNIDEMRFDLAEREAMRTEVSDIITMLIYGVEGLEDMPDIEIRDAWEDTFGKKS